MERDCQEQIVYCGSIFKAIQWILSNSQPSDIFHFSFEKNPSLCLSEVDASFLNLTLKLYIDKWFNTRRLFQIQRVSHIKNHRKEKETFFSQFCWSCHFSSKIIHFPCSNINPSINIKSNLNSLARIVHKMFLVCGSQWIKVICWENYKFISFHKYAFICNIAKLNQELRNWRRN